jgi:hypothetical protein
LDLKLLRVFARDLLTAVAGRMQQQTAADHQVEHAKAQRQDRAGRTNAAVTPMGKGA